MTVLNDFILNEKLIKLFQKILLSILLIFLAFKCAEMTWIFLWKLNSEMISPGVRNLNQNTPNKHRVDVNNIAAMHLFGKANQTTEQKIPVAIKAPETTLKLSLIGIFAADNSVDSLAIIAKKTGEQADYKINDPLPGDATLVEIHDDHVLLRRNGKYETLPLKMEIFKASLTADQSNENNHHDDNNNRRKKGKVLGQFRRQLKRDPNQAFKLIQIRPAMRNGNMLGFSLSPGRDRSLFKQFGLVSGDIVTEVNGVSVNSTFSGISALQKLTDANTINITILRNGSEQNLSYPIID